MMEIFDEVELPKGVVNLFNGDYRVGEALLAAEKIKGICFVGSTAVGQHIAEKAAERKNGPWYWLGQKIRSWC